MKCPHCGKEQDVDPRVFLWFQEPYPVTATVDAIEHLSKEWGTCVWSRDDHSYPDLHELREATKAACPVGSKGASVVVYPGDVRLVSYFI